MKWRTIKGYIDYQISETGEVRREKILIRGKRKYNIHMLIKPFKTKNGLMAINLCSNGKRKSFMLHNLYAETYGVSVKDARRIIYKGFQGNAQAKGDIRNWINEKIFECESQILAGENRNDEILYLKEFLEEI